MKILVKVEVSDSDKYCTLCYQKERNICNLFNEYLKPESNGISVMKFLKCDKCLEACEAIKGPTTYPFDDTLFPTC